MSKITTFFELLKNDRDGIERAIVYRFSKSVLSHCVPDKTMIRLQYHSVFHKKVDISSPQTFNEKLQWLKLYDRDPLHTIMVDKAAVKEYVAGKIGRQYVIPTYGIWNHFDEIDFSKLPDQFVLKCTHNSGCYVICKDKNSLNKAAVRKKLEASLKNNFFYYGREWPYKNVPKRIICEKYMEDGSKFGGLTDYKFFCFHGRVDSVMVCIERNTGNPKFYFFDQNWNLLRYNKRGKEAPEGFTLPKPETMDEMFEIAGKLSKGLKFSRIDLYSCNDKVYFGEITFFPDNGLDANILPETDLLFGNMIHLNGEEE